MNTMPAARPVPRALAIGAVALSVLAPGSVAAQACAGFNDVLASNAFCESIQWIRNRGVTQGCDAGLYCPEQNVRRDQMAAFMNRLATALTPEILYVASPTGAFSLPGAAPAAPAMPCVTADTTLQVAPVQYARQVTVTGILALRSDGTDAAWRAMPQVSIDGGASWSNLNGTNSLAMRSVAPANVWGGSTVSEHMELAPGVTYRFALAVRRDDETSTTGNIAQGLCQLAATVVNRNPATAPF